MLNVVNPHFSDATPIREIYNYVKHRGTLYTLGLGNQYSNSMVSIIDADGRKYNPRMITREVFDLDEWQCKLNKFDKSFYNYFEQLINWVLPSNFSDISIDLGKHYNYLNKRKNFAENELKSYEKKFREFYLQKLMRLHIFCCIFYSKFI